MATKQTKQRGPGTERRDDGDITDFWAKPPPPEPSWHEQVDGRPEDGFSPYALSERYAKGQLVIHGKFGKGVVVDADVSRVEVLFEHGKKKLGHGQQV